MTVRSTAPAVTLTQPIAGVMIGTPMYGGVCHDAYMLGVLDLKGTCDKAGIAFNIITLRNESLIQRARNRIVAEFLASPCSHLVFIDADIGFTGRDVLRLVAHNRPIVGATYAKKAKGEPQFAFVPLAEGTEVTKGELVEIEALPGGFMCISRDAIWRMAGAYGARRYRDPAADAAGAVWAPHLYALFECDICPRTGVYWSEDYLFCRRWREIGGQVFLDPNIMLEHNGTMTFDGDPTLAFEHLHPPAPAGATVIDMSGAGYRSHTTEEIMEVIAGSPMQRHGSDAA